jgi:hypothetical protein
MRIANDDVGAAAGEPPSKRDRTARASERGITWKSLLLAGVAVAVALLGPIALLEVASFGVRFVAKAVATVSH